MTAPPGETGSEAGTTAPKRAVRYRIPAAAMDGASLARLPSVAAAVAAAVLVSAILGSNALLDWTNALPVGTISDFLVDAAQKWHDMMDRAGMTKFAETISALLRAFEAIR